MNNNSNIKDYSITEITDDRKLTIVFYKNKDIQSIKEKSNCPSSEYQVHYSALVRQEQYADFEINLVFPLIYFNYPQQVTSVTIDFDRKDVVEVASKLVPMSLVLKQEMQRLLDSIHYSSLFRNCKNISYKLTNFNNIHRHP